MCNNTNLNNETIIREPNNDTQIIQNLRCSAATTTMPVGANNFSTNSQQIVRPAVYSNETSTMGPWTEQFHSLSELYYHHRERLSAFQYVRAQRLENVVKRYNLL